MDILLKKLEESLDVHLLRITISSPRKAEEVRKYTIRPVLLREHLVFQMESHTKTQVFHENLDKEPLLLKLRQTLPLYRQVLIRTETEEVTALINKKGKASIRSVRKNAPAQGIREPESGAECRPWAPDMTRLLHNRPSGIFWKKGNRCLFWRISVL